MAKEREEENKAKLGQTKNETKGDPNGRQLTRGQTCRTWTALLPHTGPHPQPPHCLDTSSYVVCSEFM